MSGVFMDGGSSVLMDGGSQVFMDGGQDGGHHGHFQHGDGGGDGAVMADAPQHHGGHAVQAGQGGDGFLSNLLGLDSTHHHHGFLAHLLGLDHDGGGHHSSANHAPGTHATSQGAIWSSALQGMKLSHFLQGINFSANFGLLMMFVGFTLWLFVIYAIRHNEPFANQVLGTVPMSESVATDRRLVNHLNIAMPVRISHGDVYEPLPAAEPPAQQSIEQPVPQPETSSPNTVQAIPANPNQPFGVPVGTAPQQPDMSVLPSGNASNMQNYSFTPGAQAQGMVAPAVPASDVSAVAPGQSEAASAQGQSVLPTGAGHSSYTVSSVPTRFGPKVKVIVNN
jgi:hypothetical protein